MKPYFLAACCAASLAAGNAQADVFVSGLLGISSPSESAFDDDKALRVGLGFALNETFVVEFNYVDLGAYSLNDNALVREIEAEVENEVRAQMPNANIDVHSMTVESLASGLEVALLGNYPINDDMSVYGRLGLFKWEAEAESSFAATINGQSESISVSEPFDDGVDVVVGLGGSYQLTPALSLNLEWSSYATDDMDNRVLGLGARWQF